MSSTSLAAADLSAISSFIDLLPPGVATALDPSDSVHRVVIAAALAAAGRTAARYPALYAGLNQKGNGAADSLVLVDQGRDPSGRAAAMVWQAAADEPLCIGGTLFALDVTSGELLALGHNSNVGEGFLPVSTDTPSARATGAGIKVLAVNHSVSRSGQVRFTALGSTRALYDTDAVITVIEPTQTPKTPPNVVIALGRDSVHPNPDADYTFTEPYNMDTPYLIMPFVGTADLAYTIQGTVGQPITGAQLSTQIFFVTAGGATLNIPLNPTYTTAARLAAGVTMQSATLVEWNYPADGGSYQGTTSLVYNQQSLTNEQISYFLFTFQIPLVNAPVQTFPFAVCSVNTPNERPYQCKTVPNIKFWWHCIVAGTRIALAQGGEAPIESLDNRSRVKTGTAGLGELAIEATSRGTHSAIAGQSGPQAVYRLVTDAGQELIGTGAHPIMTPAGLRILADIAVGDAVNTVEGSAKVTRCNPIAWNGVLYNLKLGNDNDRTAGLEKDAVCTYIANGIVVGDHLAMNRQHRLRSRDIDYMRSRLPPNLLADYSSALTDIRY